MDSLKIRKAVLADVPQVAISMAKAFDNDAFVNYLVHQDKKRFDRIVQLFITGLTKLSIPFGEVLTVDNCSGCAIWIPSANVTLGLLQQLALIPDILKISAFSGLMRMVKCLGELDKVHPKQKHYYLFFVGVDPSAQKQGLGHALLNPILEKCDKEGIGAYLENTNDANQAFYESNGFKVIFDIKVGVDAPVLRAMWRDPVKK
jgi:ribosomal protein S18 acetylase RimI-like enzyme